MPIGKALVVDDEELICDLISQTLEIEGYTVTAFTNSREALNELNQGNDYDVVVTDLQMPGATGADLLKKAKSLGLNCQFIMITGFTNKFTSENLEEIKPFAFINKPFDIKVLSDNVKQALQRKRELDISN